MRLTIERMRTGVLILATLLLVAVAGFLGYARYRAHNLLRDLPGKLGMQIQQSADGFTYSQSHGGHTLFTLHASRVVKYKDNGRASLHDVSILLYGADGKSADRISGQDFDFDPTTGMAQAQGDVQIDLQSPVKPAHPPQPTQPNIGQSPVPPAAAGIHVKTSGLSFDQKTGIATTTENVEFQLPQGSGTATGATYDSQRGVLMLDHAVELNASDNGNPLVMHANHAEILRDSHQGFFEKIACTYRGNHVSADHATLLFRDDGSAQQINADGSIHLQTDTGTVIDSKTGVMQMDQRSQPLKAQLSGGVAFHSYDAQSKINGNAGEGVMTFGDKGELRHATLSDLVSLVDMQVGLPNDPGGTATRQVQSQQLDVDFTTDPQQHLQLKAALAIGDAKVSLRTNPTAKANPQGAVKQDVAIAADQLLANFAAGSAITTMNGTGHTSLTDIAADGTSQTSMGDTLSVKFATVQKAATQKAAPQKAVQSAQAKPAGLSAGSTVAAGTAAQIESAVQQGNITMEQSVATTTAPASAPLDPTAATSFKATAQKATYTAATQLLHLEGSPRVTDGALDLTAATVDYARVSGDATASGGVKATYIRAANQAKNQATSQSTSQATGQGTNQSHPTQQGVLAGPGPAHIIAAQARLVHATGDAIFRGQARLWQGTNSIAAPVIELSRTQQTLRAHGESPGTAAAVNAALLTSTGTKRQPGMVRIKSQDLVYSDGERKAEFRGGVIADDGTETIRADQADVFLAPPAAPTVSKPPAPNKAASKVPTANKQATAEQNNIPASSQVDRMVATGHVVIQQPGRKGTGEQLLYTAQEGNFVLTGTGAMRPTLSDAVHGTVTGDSLIFNSRDDSVTVSGGSSGTATETRAPR